MRGEVERRFLRLGCSAGGAGVLPIAPWAGDPRRVARGARGGARGLHRRAHRTAAHLRAGDAPGPPAGACPPHRTLDLTFAGSHRGSGESEVAPLFRSSWTLSAANPRRFASSERSVHTRSTTTVVRRVRGTMLHTRLPPNPAAGAAPGRCWHRTPAGAVGARGRGGRAWRATAATRRALVWAVDARAAGTGPIPHHHRHSATVGLSIYTPRRCRMP